jgi:hypothetical protein
MQKYSIVCVCVFHTILTINDGYFHKEYQPFGRYEDVACFL